MQKLASERTESKDLGSETEGDESSESFFELVVCCANATLLLPRLVLGSRLPFTNCEKCGQLTFNQRPSPNCAGGASKSMASQKMRATA